MWSGFDLIELFSGWGGVVTLGVLCAIGFIFLKGRELASGRCAACGERRIRVEFPITLIRHDPKACEGGSTSSGDA